MRRLLLILAIVCCTAVGAKNYSIRLTVTEQDTQEAVVMGNISLKPAGILAVTDADGKALIQNVPEGEYVLNVTYVGYETINRRIRVDRDLTMNLKMTPTSLALKEVTVPSTTCRAAASLNL